MAGDTGGGEMFGSSGASGRDDGLQRHEIRVGVAHLAVWRPGDEDDRRHWHTPCWANRANRGPTRRWS